MTRGRVAETLDRVAEPAGTTAPAAPTDPAVIRPGLVRSGVLSMAALVALGLTRLIHGSLVSHATDRATYGLVGSLIAVTTIASLLLPAGVASATAKFIPYHQGRADPAAARAVHRFLARLSAGGSVVLAAGAAFGAALAFDLGPVDTAQVGALCLAFSLYSVHKSTLYGFDEINAYVRLELVCAVVTVAATVAVVLAGSRLYLVPLAVGYALFTLGAWWRLRPRGRGPRAGLPARAEILRFTALACLGTLCSLGFLQGTQLLAGWFAAAPEVAYFAAAVTLVAPAYFLPRALGLVLFPAMARAHGAGDLAQVRRNADLSTRALVVALAPVFAVGLLLAREALVLFGGPGYASGAPVLRLILVATYLAVSQVAAVNALSSGAHVRVPVGFGVLGCLTGLAVVAVLGGPLGATGVGLGYLLGTAVTAGGPIVVVWRMHRMPWAGPVARSLTVVAVAVFTGYLLDALALTTAARTIVDLGAAVVAILLILIILRRDLAILLRQAAAGGDGAGPVPAPDGRGE